MLTASVAAVLLAVCSAELVEDHEEKLLPQGVALPTDAEAMGELRKNIADHQSWLADLCQRFYCGPTKRVAAVPTHTYPCGMPSVDFASEFQATNARVHVTKKALFTAKEMEEVIALAEKEGVATGGDPLQYERSSLKWGKQVAIGTKIWKLPSVLKWFNEACKTTLWPQMAALFPDLIRDGSALRASEIHPPGVPITLITVALTLPHRTPEPRPTRSSSSSTMSHTRAQTCTPTRRSLRSRSRSRRPRTTMAAAPSSNSWTGW